MDEGQQAFAQAVRLLSRRDHSVAELRGKLTRRGHAPAAIAAAIDRLTSLGYLDDRRFATAWAGAALRSGRGVGARLRLELQQRGVAADLIAETLEHLAEEHDERQVLAQLVSRRFARFDPATADDRERRRVYAFLQRRGFALTTICAFFRDHPGGEQE
jgi:regulatory protein